MKNMLKVFISSNINLKIFAGICALATWGMCNKDKDIVRTLRVPVCIMQDTATNYLFEGPECVDVWVRCAKADLLHLIGTVPSVSIETKTLCLGANEIELTGASVVLPPAIKVLNYNPSIITITCEQPTTA